MDHLDDVPIIHDRIPISGRRSCFNSRVKVRMYTTTLAEISFAPIPPVSSSQSNPPTLPLYVIALVYTQHHCTRLFPKNRGDALDHDHRSDKGSQALEASSNSLKTISRSGRLSLSCCQHLSKVLQRESVNPTPGLTGKIF